MKTVVLTDAQGAALGVADHLDAHTGEGKLHRAFSVYVFSRDGRRLLVQQRSREKMLWPLVWANSCCSHPRPGEEIVAAGQRRLSEEWGFTCPLRPHSSFVYRAVDPGGRGVEHEHVTILLGEIDDETPRSPNPAEIADWKWIELAELDQAMRGRPEQFAPWFHLGMQRLGRVKPAGHD